MPEPVYPWEPGDKGFEILYPYLQSPGQLENLIGQPAELFGEYFKSYFHIDENDRISGIDDLVALNQAMITADGKYDIDDIPYTLRVAKPATRFVQMDLQGKTVEDLEDPRSPEQKEIQAIAMAYSNYDPKMGTPQIGEPDEQGKYLITFTPEQLSFQKIRDQMIARIEANGGNMPTHKEVRAMYEKQPEEQSVKFNPENNAYMNPDVSSAKVGSDVQRKKKPWERTDFMKYSKKMNTGEEE